MLQTKSTRIPQKMLILCLCDATFVAASIWLAVVLRLGWDNSLGYFQHHGLATAISWAIFLVVFYIGGMYESERLLSISRTLSAAVVAVALGGLLTAEIGRAHV